MGRHCRVRGLLMLALFATSCGLVPADEPLLGADGTTCPAVDRPAPAELDLGVVYERPDDGTTHVLCDVEYATSPPTSGSHFPAWQNCGFYTEPIRDETAVHALEHGAVWIAYDPDLDPVLVDEISTVAAFDPHVLAAPYPGLRNPIVLSAWRRQLAVERIGDDVVAGFLAEYLGRVSPTAPEAGVRCDGGIGAPPFDPDRDYEAAFAVFAEG